MKSLVLCSKACSIGLFLSAFLIISLLFLVASTDSAVAQTPDEREMLQRPSDSRTPEDLRPKGLVWRGFLYRPALEIESGYIDNVLAEDQDIKSDFFTRVKPSLRVEKEIGRHSLFFTGRANVERFAKRSKENVEEFSISTSGVIEAKSDLAFPFRIQYSQDHRNRDEPTSNLSTDTPRGVDRLLLKTGVIKKFNRLNLSIQGEYEKLRFDNEKSLNRQEAVIFDDNDREEYAGLIRLSYEFPRNSDANNIEHEVFTNLRVETQEFERGEFTGNGFDGPRADRDIYQGLLGFRTDYKGLLFARIALGYEEQIFEADSIENISYLDFLADIEYVIHPKMTLRLNAARDIIQTADNQSGITETTFLGGLDYELLHDLYLETEYRYKDFKFESSERKDKDHFGIVRLNHILSRYLSAELEATHQRRSSTIDSEEFDRTIFLLRLRGEL